MQHENSLKMGITNFVPFGRVLLLCFHGREQWKQTGQGSSKVLGATKTIQSIGLRQKSSIQRNKMSSAATLFPRLAVKCSSRSGAWGFWRVTLCVGECIDFRKALSCLNLGSISPQLQKCMNKCVYRTLKWFSSANLCLFSDSNCVRLVCSRFELRSSLNVAIIKTSDGVQLSRGLMTTHSYGCVPGRSSSFPTRRKRRTCWGVLYGCTRQSIFGILEL